MRSVYEVGEMEKKFNKKDKKAFSNSIAKWLKSEEKYDYFPRNKEELIERIYNAKELEDTYDLPILWYNGFATNEQMENYIF